MGRSPSRNESLSPEWRAAVAQDRARPGESTWLGDYDAEIMDTQAPQVSSSTSPEPDGRDDFAKLDPAEFPDARNQLELLDRLFPRKTTVDAPNQRQRFVELFPALVQALVQTPA